MMRAIRPAGASGAILLEVMVALSIFAMAALAVIGAVAQGRAGVGRAHLELRAADLARSVMSLIEAGVVSPEAVSGPAPVWDPTIDLASEQPLRAVLAETSGSRGLDERGWRIEAEIEPTEFDGVSLVIVRTALVLGADPDAPEARATLRQFVRLEPGPEDALPSIEAWLPEVASGDGGESGFAARSRRLERDAMPEREDPFGAREDPFDAGEGDEADRFESRRERLRRETPGRAGDAGAGDGGGGGGR